jgi:hypothetical protein
MPTIIEIPIKKMPHVVVVFFFFFFKLFFMIPNRYPPNTCEISHEFLKKIGYFYTN